MRIRPHHALALLAVTWYACSAPELEWHETSSHRWAELPATPTSTAGFTHLSPGETGVDHINSLTKQQIAENRHLLNGSGVALGDFDGDGWTDIYLARLNGPNSLYRNLGDWKFEEVAAARGASCDDQFSTGAVFADINGDQHLDLLVTAYGGPNHYLQNDGAGNFRDVTETSGFTSTLGGASLALADIDGDRDLDVYVANNKVKTIRDVYSPSQRSFERTVRKVGDRYELLPEFQKYYTLQQRGNRLERFEYAEPDQLYLNDGNGKLVPVAMDGGRFRTESGVPAPPDTDWGLSARFQDIDQDGDPDLYVCNDFESPDRIWINDGTGHFDPIAPTALRSTAASSMGIDFADIDHDGDMDFFVAEMLSPFTERRKRQQGFFTPEPPAIGRIADRPQYMRNMLYLNRGDNTYTEIAHFAGAEATDWTWTPLFFDADLDGYDDLFVVTGHYYDAMDTDTRINLKSMSDARYRQFASEIFAYPNLATPNFALRNNGDLTFSNVSTDWGFATNDISHGMALADLDNDGDLDIVVNRLDSTAAIFRNDAGKPRIAIRLRGNSPNTQAIGAQIQVSDGNRSQQREVISGGAYLSGSDPLYVFAASAGAPHQIKITWPGGAASDIDARANKIYEVFEPTDVSSNGHTTNGHSPDSSPGDSRQPLARFEDKTDDLGHEHLETPFDDLALQPLLPIRMSQSGPGMAIGDLNNDGLEDIVITSGRGGSPTALLNTSGAFAPIDAPAWQRTARWEQSAVLLMPNPDQSMAILIAHSNYEATAGEHSFVARYRYANDNIAIVDTLWCGPEALGPLAAADIDGDGDLDLFAGGRGIPGRYPAPGASYIFTNSAGRFTPDTLRSSQLSASGIVSGAVFTQLDANFTPELVLATHWGPLRVYTFTSTGIKERTAAFGLDSLTGWWNGVTAGDFDNDGQMDLVATNWGLNTALRASVANPLKAYYRDFDVNGTLDYIESRYDALTGNEVPERSLATLTQAMPFLRHRVRTNREFAQKDLESIIGYQLRDARVAQATTLGHHIFLNKGQRFESHPLPAAAQFAPAFHVSVADFNLDGNEDLYLSQNFFAYPTEMSRSDAGRGLLLYGDGSGGFICDDGVASGIDVYGEGRAAAVFDPDNDGRADLVASQNGAATRLFKNTSRPRGIRIRLRGDSHNPSGFGSILRIQSGGRLGPARELHAGSGYWTQSSAVSVVAIAGDTGSVHIRWPDGVTRDVPITANTQKLQIRYPGNTR